MEEPIIEKLTKYGFEEAGKWEIRNKDTNIRLEIWNEKFRRMIDKPQPMIYAIVIGNKAKYIGSTIRGKKRGYRLQAGEYVISELKLGKTKQIYEELKRRHESAKLHCLEPPQYNHKGLRFLMLRDLENALIKDLRTTEEYDGWNKKVDN